METQFFTYGNIIRVLKYNPEDDSKAAMVDINAEDNTILSVFDAPARPTDLMFIKSFVNILNQSTVGFNPTDNEAVKTKALGIISSELPDIQI